MFHFIICTYIIIFLLPVRTCHLNASKRSLPQYLSDKIIGKNTSLQIIEYLCGKIQLLFNQARINTSFRRTTTAAKEHLAATGHTSAAIELEDGTIITAHSSELLGCSAALLLNVTKHLAQIDHEIKLIPQSMIEPIQHTKVSYLGGRNPRLHTDEVLVALSVLSENDENCRRALEQLPKLRGCQVHCTVMLSEVDQRIFKKLGVNLTCEPVLKR